MNNAIFLGKSDNGWVEIRIGGFKCEASYLTSIPFDILKANKNQQKRAIREDKESGKVIE